MNVILKLSGNPSGFISEDSQKSAVSAPYEFRKSRISEIPFLEDLSKILEDEIRVYMPTDARGFRRTEADGAFMIRGTAQGQGVAVIWHDFRIAGGSYGKKLSDRMKAFLDQCGAENLPLIVKISSVGVRFMEGRTVFDHAFALVPELLAYRNRNLVITIGHGQTLGLGALAFRLGHYRMQSLIGPMCL